MTHLFKIFGGAVAALSLAACAAIADTPPPLDPQNAADTLTLMRKMQCSTVDEEPAVYWWHGKAYARRQGEKDTHLFNVEGMNIRACSAIEGDNGKGFALVSRELLLYLDKETGQPLKTWDNPFTGETVPVLHVANDPVNFEMYETGRDGQPVKWGGEILNDVWWYRSTFPLWYPNPLGGEFQEEVGGTYHATELFNFFGHTDDLLDPTTTSVKTTVGWSRMSDWLPWMMMNGREGMFWVHTAGAKLESYDDLSDVMKAEIATHYPEYNSPPPTGDPRDNMTSWKYYKGVAKGDIEAPTR